MKANWARGGLWRSCDLMRRFGLTAVRRQLHRGAHATEILHVYHYWGGQRALFFFFLEQMDNLKCFLVAFKHYKPKPPCFHQLKWKLCPVSMLQTFFILWYFYMTWTWFPQLLFWFYVGKCECILQSEAWCADTPKMHPDSFISCRKWSVVKF